MCPSESVRVIVGGMRVRTETGDWDWNGQDRVPRTSSGYHRPTTCYSVGG